MRIIFVSLFMLLANIGQAANIATVSPIAHSMSRTLVENTPIEVTYLPPTRLPINRIPSWLNRSATEPMEHFDAIVNISSMRPDLAFYVPLRSRNIRIVPIDIAKAMIPGGREICQCLHRSRSQWQNLYQRSDPQFRTNTKSQYRAFWLG